MNYLKSDHFVHSKLAVYDSESLAQNYHLKQKDSLQTTAKGMEVDYIFTDSLRFCHVMENIIFRNTIIISQLNI